MAYKKHTSGLSLFKRLWRSYISPYKLRLALAILFMALSAASTAGLAKFMEPVIDDVFKSENAHMLQVISVSVLVLFMIKGIAAYGESITMNYIGQRIISNIQTDLFSHLVYMDLSYMHDHPTGSLISRCTNDVNLMRSLVSNAITSLGKDVLTVICLVSVMFYQEWRLSLIAFVVLPLAVFPIVRFGKKIRKVSTSTQEETGFFLSLLKEIFQGARLVKAYNMENYEISRAKKTIEDLFKLAIKSNHIKSLSSPIMETLGGLVIVIIIAYGGYEVIKGYNTAGAFFSFITAFLLAYEPMKRLANLNANLQEGLAAAVRVFNVLDTPIQIKDALDAQSDTIQQGLIEFERVSFSYDTKTAPSKKILRNISLTIPKNTQAALVGPSGSGKSTLLNLIPRFYDVTSGTIKIDERPIDQFTLHNLRDAIGLVSQEITLFDDTVRANILYGNLNASDAEAIKAAKGAAAHDFIMKLPRQYDTMIGESGIKLSGGQRQRLSIARALLKNAPILLLDEATSSLDTESEHQVQKALHHLMKGRTCLIIAHRLSTVRNVDIIFVLDEGQVVEQGTHDELIKKDGVYAQLCQWQLISDSDEPS